MAFQYVNTGTSANKGDGDSLRTAFNKINYNFSQLTSLSTSTSTAEIIVGLFPPVAPQEGNIWFNTGNGTTYVYYTDLDSAQWVAMSGINNGTGTNILNFPVNPVVNASYTSPTGIVYVFNGIAWDFAPPATLNIWKYVKNNYSALNNERIIADTSTGTFTITLPSGPVNGSYVQITDGGNFLSNNLIVNRNGSTIEGYSDNVALDLQGVTYEFVYANNTWNLTATTGARGAQGIQGLQGTSSQGVQGLQGIQGVSIQGIQGETGLQGLQGLQGGGGDFTATSTNTLTNKTINIQSGQGNIFQIQGNSILSYSGSGGVVLLQQTPTLNSFNIGNGSGLTVDGGTGSSYWSGQSGVAQSGINKAGVYRTSSAATNALFTFGANGAGTMSLAVEGSFFLGTAVPNNAVGLTTDYSGWLVVGSGGKFGGDIDTLGRINLNGNNAQDDTAIMDFYSGAGAIGNHIVTLDSDWTMKIKARSQGANQGNLWLEAGQNTKIKVKGNGSNIDIVASDGSTSATWNFAKTGSLTFPDGTTQTTAAVVGGGVAGDRLTSSTYNVILEGTTGTVSVPNTIISQGYELGLAGSQGSYEVARYLRVRDGDVYSHLHLDTPDNNTYDIILGNDQKFVRVDHTGTVAIGTNNGTQHEWTFSADGVLTFPNGTTQTTAFGFIDTIPVSSTSTGIKGQMAVDTSSLYVCVGTDTWLKFNGVTF